ncbi:hypothetical protein FRC03_010814 [Tulasnella sp. 419]|nr:hypothetical protein FRC03_010814 [Tulasnella sp. 419]
MILSSITTAPDNYTEVVLATQPFQPTSAIFSRSSSPNSLLSAISRSQWSEWSMYEGNDEKLWKVTTGVELSSGKRVMLMDWLLQGDLPYMVQKLSDTMEAGYLHHLRELKIVGLSYLLDWRLGSSFHRLPNLEVLRIVSREDNEDDEWSQDALGSFLRRLCTSSPTRGRGSVSCPRLRHITIELDFIDWNVLEEIVEARTSIAETNGQCNLVLELANRAKKTGSSYERLIEFAEKRGVIVRDLSRVS